MKSLRQVWAAAQRFSLCSLLYLLIYSLIKKVKIVKLKAGDEKTKSGLIKPKNRQNQRRNGANIINLDDILDDNGDKVDNPRQAELRCAFSCAVVK